MPFWNFVIQDSLSLSHSKTKFKIYFECDKTVVLARMLTGTIKLYLIRLNIIKINFNVLLEPKCNITLLTQPVKYFLISQRSAYIKIVRYIRPKRS